MNELNKIIEIVMGATGYYFEPAHPPDCECHEFGSDTAKDGWWKDGDFISSEALKPAHSQLQALITEQVRLGSTRNGRGQAPTTPKDSVSELMGEWFRLKDAQTAKKRELVEFHETYECTNMQATDHNEYPTQCIYREINGYIPSDACEPCRKRHNYYLQRKENAHKRTQILLKVRRMVAGAGRSSAHPKGTTLLEGYK